MGKVMPFRRQAAVAQCRQSMEMESLVAAQVQLWFAWARAVNRIWWGA